MLNALKIKRLELAQEQDVPAFVIFHDKTLTEMAHKKPASKDEFAELYGVGGSKVEKFYEIFREVIAQY